MFLDLNLLVHNEFNEIKKKLIEFHLGGNNGEEKVEIKLESFIHDIVPIANEYYLTKIFYQYSVLKMEKEITSVLNSLVETRGKEIIYNEQEMLDQTHKYSVTILKLLKQID